MATEYKSHHGETKNLPQPSLRRMPLYFAYLKELAEAGQKRISSAVIAAELNLHPVQVRKDLALTEVTGRPRTGFDVQALLTDIRRLLDYDNVKKAVVVGAGHLGKALLAYHGFQEFGLQLVAAVDSNPGVIGSRVGEVEVAAMEDLPRLVRDGQIRIGIITTPAAVAQDCCDRLVAAGIEAIWNFAPIHLQVPEQVVLQHENIAVSLSLLSKRLSDAE